MAKCGKIRTKRETRDDEDRSIRRKRQYRQYILIVCDDEAWAPYYFKQFKVIFENILPQETLFLHTIGKGYDSQKIVEFAKEERLNFSVKLFQRIEFDQVWVVFDKDDLDKSGGNRLRFEQAFEIAKREKIEIAYSNECFELWLLLHFIDVNLNTPLPRTDIYTKLESCINKGRTVESQIKYDHKHFDKQIIDIIFSTGNEAKAIERAKYLHDEHSHLNHQPIESNPCTTVYLLVECLRNLQKYYSIT